MVGDPPSLSLSSSALYRGFFSSFHLFLNLYLSQTPRVTSFAVPPVRSVLPADPACPLSFVRSESTERAHVSADCVDSGVIPGKTRRGSPGSTCSENERPRRHRR